MSQHTTPIKHILTIAITTLILLFGAVQPALADGIIIPDPPPGPVPVPLEESWLTIRYHRVSVTIEDQIATTRVEQEFLNEHDWEAEGTYIFPLPEGAAVSNFTMWVDGVAVEGQILEADEARQIYEEIVRERRDPALLEYVGTDAVKARIFPIPAGGSRVIELEYTQILPVENGLVRYTYPLNTEKFSARPLENCSVRVDLRSDDPMRAIYSPTHQDRIFIDRKSDRHAIIGYEENNVLPEQDFELVYTLSHEDVGLNLLTYAGDSAEDGFFLLMAAPTVKVEHIIPRDVVLVLDISGSMEGEKLSQAKDALAYILGHLNQEDRFNVIAFSTGLKRYAYDLRPVSEADDAADWVKSLQALGGTNINLALLDALSLGEIQPHGEGEKASGGEDRPLVVIFLTDGLPTEGVTEIEQILSNVEGQTSSNVRLFPFGVGNDVNTLLLDTLAEGNRGATGYVRPHENIQEEVSGLYAKIKTPVLTDISLDFGGVVVEDVYPYTLPDLFAGEQLILTGRYRLPSGGASQAATITLTGQVNGERREFVYEGVFCAAAGDDFIPRLWATRKIGYLLTQIRLHGENAEWVDAIVDLSVRYGIITPYTSFLIQEDDILTSTGRDEAAKEYMAQPTAPVVGAPAAEEAEAQADMRGAGSVAPLSESVVNAISGEVEPVVQHVGEKTFLLQNGVWIDTTFDAESMTSQRVGFGTETYFELLDARPAWGDYLSLGERVIFVAEGEVYEVVSEGEESESVEIPPASTSSPPDVPSAPQPISAPDDAGGSLCPGSMVLGVVMLGVGFWRRR